MTLAFEQSLRIPSIILGVMPGRVDGGLQNRIYQNEIIGLSECYEKLFYNIHLTN